MKRVAAYCRVSTEKMDQVNSFSTQKAFFTHYVNNNPDWTLTKIYADEGITGTTATDRTGFLTMIDDALAGAFDIIVTKEVSRFSRNLLDAVFYSRKLKEAGVGVIFLNDGISTLDADAELRLGIMAAVAQEESRRTSERVRWGQLRKMELGVVFGRSLLGYDVKNGRLIVEPKGAETIRTIYRMYLDERLGVRTIANFLTDMNTPTRSGNTMWSGSAVLKILRNEKYCGDLVQRKTVTTNFLTHKKQRNNDGLIFIPKHHEPIISPDIWQAVQAELSRRSRSANNKKNIGSRYTLSGKISCAGCGAVYFCRTRIRKDGSTYRTWNCMSCVCHKWRRQIREEVFVKCVRRMIDTIDTAILLNGFEEILSSAWKEKSGSTDDLENNICVTQKKKLKLIDTYLSGELSREEYASLKTRYEAEIKAKQSKLMQLRTSHSSEGLAEALGAALQLASGEDQDDAFYLFLIEQIKVDNDKMLTFTMSNSVFKWSVEF